MTLPQTSQIRFILLGQSLQLEGSAFVSLHKCEFDKQPVSQGQL